MIKDAKTFGIQLSENIEHKARAAQRLLTRTPRRAAGKILLLRYVACVGDPPIEASDF